MRSNADFHELYLSYFKILKQHNKVIIRFKGWNSFKINGCLRKEPAGEELKVEKEVQEPFIAVNAVRWYPEIKQRKLQEESPW